MIDITYNGEKLDPEFKAKWLELLRSGYYQQAEGSLRLNLNDYDEHPEYGYCCLGIAEIACGVNPENLNSGVYDMPSDFKNTPENFPAILNTIYETEEGRTLAGELAHANDDGNTFEQIANWVEKNL